MNYLIRHSIDDNTRKGGWSAAPLTAEGFILAQQTAEKIKKLEINCIVCSDLVRTKETAKIINKQLKLPIFFEKSLRELNAGIISGMKYEDAEKICKIGDKDYLNMNFKYPGGETLGDFKKRVLDFYYNVICKTDNTLFVTHRNVISVIYNEINGTTWDFCDKTTIKIPHCSVFEIDDKHIKIINDNDKQK